VRKTYLVLIIVHSTNSPTAAGIHGMASVLLLVCTAVMVGAGLRHALVTIIHCASYFERTIKVQASAVVLNAQLLPMCAGSFKSRAAYIALFSIQKDSIPYGPEQRAPRGDS
jgi:hypothetical protein